MTLVVAANDVPMALWLPSLSCYFHDLEFII